jgi:hypothetical protein
VVGGGGGVEPEGWEGIGGWEKRDFLLGIFIVLP